MIMMKASQALLTLLAASSLHQQGTNAQGQDDFRFRKFNNTNPSISTEGPIVKFPLDKKSADFLRQNTRSISVVLKEEVCSVDLDIPLDNLRRKKLYPVTHPNDIGFWADFEKVVQVQAHLKSKQQNQCMVDPLPLVMPHMTQYWRGFDILEVAEAVHDEFPGLYHYRMLADWVGKREVVYDNDVITKFGNIDFLRREVMLSDMVGYSFRAVGPCNFSLKWSEGRARPEEVAFAVANGQIRPPKGVDISDISRIISDMNLRDPTDFTAYAEGSPTHPSWPAMHSASSVSSFWLDVVLELTEEQRCDARMLDWSVSYARTVAGVHYTTDNISGLTVGQDILAQLLPDHLSDVYGANKKVVDAKIQRAMVDWTEFENSDCFKQERFRTVPAAKPAVCFNPPSPRPSPATKSSKSSKSSKSKDKSLKSNKNLKVNVKEEL
mmetsp:Transcript_17540/g.25599  ORF Transcript_17540/g.25599 Transcript_17540/m.25599 type:complete len:437 (-) Transcript_17540:761-2071(-)